MALNDSEDASSSMVASDSDAVNGSNGSALTTKPKRTRSGTWFRAWSFQVTLKADLSQACKALPHKIRQGS
jgi:hypothetical protein